MNARNFGLKSRNIVMAGKNALRNSGASFGSISTNLSHWRYCAKYLFEQHDIKDMRFIEHHHFVEVAESISDLVDAGELTLSTAHDRIAAVNVIMKEARQDKEMWVSPVQYLGQRSGIRTESRALTNHQVKDHSLYLLNQKYGKHLNAIHEMTVILGVRFEEGSKIDANKAFKEAIKHKTLHLTKGTKGGRSRVIANLNTMQIGLLKKVASIQGKSRSLIPEGMSYKKWKNHAYKALKNAAVNGWHPGRHTYAIKRYEKLTGVLPPVMAQIKHGYAHHKYLAEKCNLSITVARAKDKSARLQIARELGHNRVQITNAYLG